MKESQFTFTGIVRSRRFEWKPQDDIAAHELALCMPMLLSAVTAGSFCVGAMFDGLPDNAKRHFVEL